jgi:hypothetical protein
MNAPKVFQLDEVRIARQVLAGRVKAFTDSLMASVLSSPLGTLLLAWVEASVAGWRRAVLWLCLINLVEVVTFALAWRCRKAQSLGEDELPWTRRLFGAHFLLGLCWGS